MKPQKHLMLILSLLLCSCGKQGGELELDASTDSGSDEDSASLPDLSFSPTPDLLPGWRLSWVRSAGNGSADVLADLDQIGTDLVATGFYSSDITFGPGEPNETHLANVGDNMYLAKLKADGSLVWATGTHGGEALGADVVADAEGNLFVVGRYYEEIILGEGEPNETIFACDDDPFQSPQCLSKQEHLFMASYRSDGRLAWARTVRTLSDDEDPDGCSNDHQCTAMPGGIGIFSDGSILTASAFQGKMAIDPGTTDEQRIASNGGWDESDRTDCLLVKCDSTGKRLWHKVLGGPGRDGCIGIEPLADDSFYLTGHFEGTLVLGEGEPNETVLTAAWYTSAFLAKYDNDANLIWARDLGIDGDVNSAVFGPKELDNGDVAVAGRFRGKMAAGDGEEGEIVESSMDGRGIFVARYTAEGARLWNRVELSSNAISTARDVEELSDGALIVVGNFHGETTFGAGETNETTLGAVDDSIQSYMAMYTAEGRLEWVLGQGGGCNDLFQDVEVFQDEVTGEEWLIVGGDYCGHVTFGTGGGDEISVSPFDDDFSDIAILRFDRE